jgi:amino acid adenylation domain-containing protein
MSRARGRNTNQIVVFDRRIVEERDYWLKKLSGLTRPLGLWPDYPQWCAESGETSEVQFEINGVTYQALAKLTGEGPFLTYTVLMAALKVCLHKYTMCRRIIVGSPTRLDIENLSLPANALAISSELDECLSFRQLILNERQTLLDAYSRQSYPFERLIKDLGLKEIESRFPLFDIALTMDGLHREMPEINNAITIRVSKQAGFLAGRVSFKEGLFKVESIYRFIKHLVKVLGSALEETSIPISKLELLTDEELNQVLLEWNRTRADFPAQLSVPDLFEMQVECAPDANAVLFGDQHLTYGELNRRANQLAHYLKEFGAKPEDLVGIYIEPSVEMVISIIGILKAGAAYFPLDPGAPKDRLSLMLEDARVDLLITQKYLAGDVSQSSVKKVCLDEDWPTIQSESKDNPVEKIGPHHLAYVLYTSGSTGRPKGTMIAHRSLVNYLFWVNRELLGDNGQSLPLISRIAFDISLKQLLAPLICGGEVLIINPHAISQPSVLLEELDRCNKTWLNCVPSLWKNMLETSGPGADTSSLGKLSHLILSGEAFDEKLVERSVAAAPHLDIRNVYGPTEATGVTTVARISDKNNITIGRPIANARVYLLDSSQSPMPVGAPGELCIGGMGVARGYNNRSELTAKKFIPDPFSEEPGARLYRTGDLARFLPDGRIEFLGRIDHQVKVRGFRIELGEIEALLSSRPDIREAVVVVREDIPSDQRLIAYVVCVDDAVPGSDDLRSFLEEKLPDYMVPAVFIKVDTLPLNANGKVDRKALPAPSSARPGLNNAFIPPRTPTEELLAGIWAQILGLEQVGVHDNFFRLGGHSLLATQVMSRACTKFSLELPLRKLFETPTVAGLAESIERALKDQSILHIPPLEPVLGYSGLPLSFAQQRLWFIDQLEPGNPAYNVPIAIRLTGWLNIPALEETFGEIARRHKVLRTIFPALDGNPMQVVTSIENFSLPVISLSDLNRAQKEAKVKRLVREEAQKPFDLAHGPLLRASLLALSDREHILMLTAHHIVCDAWSLELLFREVAPLYEVFINGCQSMLPELSLQYADFAYWQKKWLRDEVLEAKLSYWKKQLSGPLPILRLPTDSRESKEQANRGACQSLDLPRTLVESLKELSHRKDVTLFMTSLAAFDILLYYYTGQSDIIVGTNVASRNRPEIEGLIGFFINQLVLRVDLSGNPTFEELLRRVADVTLSAYSHHETPFEKLVEVLRPERDLNRTPLYQVKIDFHSESADTIELHGVNLEALEIDWGPVHSDLLLSIIETREGLSVTLNYDAGLFKSTTIAKMLAHFEKILRMIISQSDLSLDLIVKVLTDADKQEQICQEKKLEAISFHKLRRGRQIAVPILPAEN